MTQDNGLDNPMPISREGLIEALTTAINLIPSYAWEATDYLERLVSDIRSDTANEYPPVIRREKGKG